MTFKKIYSLFALAIVAAGLAACSDDDAGSEYLHQSQVSITSSSITFTAKADTGSVEFTAPAGATATATVASPWATATVDGNTVHVSVQNNPNLEGRATLLTIKAGNDSANVTVQQQGMNYKYDGESYYIFNDSSRTISLPVTNEGGTVVATTDSSATDWATPTVTENGIDVVLAENNSGHIRQGYVYVNDGPYNDTILVMQGELKDIENKYYIFAGYDVNLLTENTQSIDEIFSYMQGAIIDYQGQPVIYFPDDQYVLPITFDQSTLSFRIDAGEAMGTYYNYYYLYSGIIDLGWYNAFTQNNLNAYYSMPGSGLSMTGVLAYDDEMGTIVEFVNSSTNDLIYALTQDNTQTWDANIFAISALTSTWEAALQSQQLPSFAGDLIKYYSPAMIEGYAGGGSNAGAKPAPGTNVSFNLGTKGTAIQAARFQKAQSVPSRVKRAPADLNISNFNPAAKTATFNTANAFKLLKK